MSYVAQGNLWILLPAILISLWNFIDGRFRPSDSYFVWPLLVIAVNVALNLWAVSVAGGSLWILIPILFLGIWNFIDGRIRRQSQV
ncbi:hypothetical protein A3K29_03775 [Candidatus Collierbacteria bacterium RIFOXYB2_FULL_46_14]|nr:MAG: hypothetical protein A3K29_03775 [Candidatus Collierbacteria bacterium RIFOXYB2_FULL_46_14]OGD76276.1 MAG: hypothetical protein A3K43_03775 [Candidatus Collierbacteria bacterium RIFOXYA2_FULL_46_20]OGD77612.1 MAG: hypothetical protein A3K39_03775 [Candidatus Collierbacteria bacterium RIFOXYC2_FULL_43_15]OGD80902.1 MAG: hypothetical protein A2320_04270 [Pseudomonadales bacterium GWC2_63_15]OGD82334.1 MAG: hypothetical protein A3K36_03775 [Candidatus Collierbacteria bacterium RIFOXYD2_FUL